MTCTEEKERVLVYVDSQFEAKFRRAVWSKVRALLNLKCGIPNNEESMSIVSVPKMSDSSDESSDGNISDDGKLL